MPRKHCDDYHANSNRMIFADRKHLAFPRGHSRSTWSTVARLSVLLDVSTQLLVAAAYTAMYGFSAANASPSLIFLTIIKKRAAWLPSNLR